MGLFGGKKKEETQDSVVEEKAPETTTSRPPRKQVKEIDQSLAPAPHEPVENKKLEDEILSEVLDGPTKKKKKAKDKKLELTTSVFEFGSAVGNKGLTLAGFCPISDEHEPCKWEVIDDGGPEQPAIRIIF